MDEYLLDANHIIPLLRENDAERGRILSKLSMLPPQSHICIAASTLAELEVGCCFVKQGREQAQVEIRGVVSGNKLDIRAFTHHTAAVYGELKAALMRKYALKEVGKSAKWPEVWTSPVKGQPLGADEFDLILVSHAIERNTVLVTDDSMTRIVEGLTPPVPVPRFENWIKGSPS